MFSEEEERAYYAALPRKACSAAVLLRDADGRVLLVKPTYKPHWQIPGGVVDADEALRAAATRELREELGLSRDIGKLLVVQYSQRGAMKGDVLHMIFDGGVVANDDLGTIVLQESELGEWRLVDTHEIAAFLPEKGRLRCEAALRAIETNEMAYLEE